MNKLIKLVPPQDTESVYLFCLCFSHLYNDLKLQRFSLNYNSCFIDRTQTPRSIQDWTTIYDKKGEFKEMKAYIIIRGWKTKAESSVAGYENGINRTLMEIREPLQEDYKYLKTKCRWRRGKTWWLGEGEGACVKNWNPHFRGKAESMVPKLVSHG